MRGVEPRLTHASIRLVEVWSQRFHIIASLRVRVVRALLSKVVGHTVVVGGAVLISLFCFDSRAFALRTVPRQPRGSNQMWLGSPKAVGFDQAGQHLQQPSIVSGLSKDRENHLVQERRLTATNRPSAIAVENLTIMLHLVTEVVHDAFGHVPHTVLE